MAYVKDDRKNRLIVDYSGTFGKVDELAIRLINSCKWVYKDAQGEYTYLASLRADGLVQFTRENIKH